MTTDDRAAYLDAFSAARKRFERNGAKIHHATWHDGRLTVLVDDPSVVAASDGPEFLPVERPKRTPRGLIQEALL